MPGMSVTLRAGSRRISTIARDSPRPRWRRCDSCGCGSRLRRRSPSGRQSPRAGARFPCSPIDPPFNCSFAPFSGAASTQYETRAPVCIRASGDPRLRARSQPFARALLASYQPLRCGPILLPLTSGVNLAASPESATLDAAGQLLIVLAGTSVTIDGIAAPLIYVSPAQINMLIPVTISAGTSGVTIASSITGGKQTGTMQVVAVAPAIFSLDASGKGPGAVLNAVTYAGAPFLVETPQNGGADLRTRLAIDATGLRHAGNVVVQAQDSTARAFPWNSPGPRLGNSGLIRSTSFSRPGRMRRGRHVDSLDRTGRF